jgi:hypothetical protein
MSIERRTADRRRRVLYSTHHSDLTTTGDLERLREARRPAAVYGSRVHRRLRARWFSLVPVRRSTMIVLASVLVGISCLLCLGHYAAVAWPAVAYRPEIARPLRLDRPDSFGRWFMVAMLTGSAGASFLIYQLRRHRNDDFAGQYRLWRTVLIVALLASLHVLVSVIDWGGALLDLAFGRRVALTGSDWIHLVVMFGGAVLSLQMMAEIRRCRSAMGAMLSAVLCWTISEAAQWNVLQVTTLNRWVLVTTAPLLASTAVFIATVAYLRMLYREVRQVNDAVSMRERWQRMRQSWFDRDPEEAVENKPAKRDPKEPRRRWFQRDDRPKQPLKIRKQGRQDEVTEEPPSKQVDRSRNEQPETPEPQAEKRSWFGLKRKSRVDQDASEVDAGDDRQADQTPKPPKPRRRFSLRLAPPTMKDTTTQADEEDESVDSTAEQPKQRRGWLRRKEQPAAEVESSTDEVEEADGSRENRGWFRRKKPAASEPTETDESAESPPSNKGIGGWLRRKKTTEVETETSAEDRKSRQSAQTPAAETDESVDSDDIDWNGLSKSERRRLRKQLKRQDRAA